MANWKIQDIAPPRQKHTVRVEEPAPQEEQSVPPTSERKRFLKGGSFWLKAVVAPFFLVVLLGVGVLHFFFAEATVTVWPETRDIALSETLIADTTVQSASPADRVVPAKTFTVTKQETRLFASSLKTIRENRASGTLRVFNAADTQPKTLVAQTRFVAEGGELFRSPERIVVPGGTMQGGKLMPGYVDIEVTAAEAGADYNIDPSNFSLPGLSGSVLFTTIYAESFEKMTGGSEREVSIVSAEDIESAKEELIADLSGKARQELLAEVPEGMVAGEGSIGIDVQEAVSPIQPGSEIDQFNVSVVLEATAYAVAEADIQAFVAGLVSPEVQEGERIADDKTVYSFGQILPREDGTVSLRMDVLTVAFKHMDATELKLKIRGKSAADAQSALLQLPAFRQSEISLWPFWISSVPGDVDKLNVQTVID